jgi:hypothetical protein
MDHMIQARPLTGVAYRRGGWRVTVLIPGGGTFTSDEVFQTSEEAQAVRVEIIALSDLLYTGAGDWPGLSNGRRERAT